MLPITTYTIYYIIWKTLQ